jgi:DNA recombination protein RmuC
VLTKVKRQLETASRTIDETGVRTRAMERKLRAVEQLPDAEAERVLDLAGAVDEPEPEELGQVALVDKDGETPT